MKTPLFLSCHYNEIESSPFTLFNVDSPEKYMLYSMLCRAIEDAILLKKTKKKRISKDSQRVAKEAYDWISNASDYREWSSLWVLSNITSDPETALKCLVKALNCEKTIAAIIQAKIGYRPSGNASTSACPKKPR